MKNILLVTSVLFLSGCLSTTGSGKPTLQGGSTFNGYIGCYNGVCTEFLPEKNEDGVILTSTGVSYERVQAKKQKILNKKSLPIEKLYVGRSCDSFSKQYGKGSWGWDSKGFVVTFKTIKFTFSNQKLDIDKDEKEGCRL